MEKSKTKKPKQTQAIGPVPNSVKITMVLAVVGGLLFIKPFIGVILFSGLVAFIFNPVYKSVLKRTKRESLALTSTIAVAILSFILPLLLIVGVTVAQASSLVSRFQSQGTNLGAADIDSTIEKGTDKANSTLRSLPGGDKANLNKEDVKENLKKLGTELAQGVANILKSAAGAATGLISSSILALFLILSMLRYQNNIKSFLKNVSPFHDSITDNYMNQAGAMTKAMVKGQLIIAVFQGVASAFSLWIVGIDYFWFFVMLLTFLSFIPLGGGILTIPIGIIIILTGNIAQGIFVILFHLLVVSSIDNILRPRLVPKSAQLNSGLVLLAVFSGIAMFGAAGVIYGPVLIIILMTTYKMYAEYNKRAERALPPSA